MEYTAEVRRMSRRALGSLFILVAILLALPWLTVSCQGQLVARGTGYQVMTGNIQESASSVTDESATDARQPGSFLLWVTFVCTLVGVLAGLFGPIEGNAASSAMNLMAVLGGIQTTAVLLFMVTIRNRVYEWISGSGSGHVGVSEMAQMISVAVQPGCYLTLIVSAIICFLGLQGATKLRGEMNAGFLASAASPEDSGPARGRTCPSCGAMNPAGNMFCTNCGVKLEDQNRTTD